MPKIIKPKKTNLPVVIKTTKKSRPKKVKRSPVEYYNCLLTSARNNWYDPHTGQKKKITTCCRECKLNAPVLNRQREQELHKLITSYRQVGDSLTKLLKPIK